MSAYVNFFFFVSGKKNFGNFTSTFSHHILLSIGYYVWKHLWGKSMNSWLYNTYKIITIIVNLRFFTIILKNYFSDFSVFLAFHSTFCILRRILGTFCIEEQLKFNFSSKKRNKPEFSPIISKRATARQKKKGRAPISVSETCRKLKRFWVTIRPKAERVKRCIAYLPGLFRQPRKLARLTHKISILYHPSLPIPPSHSPGQPVKQVPGRRGLPDLQSSFKADNAGIAEGKDRVGVSEQTR